jgi:hypothetical protein
MPQQTSDIKIIVLVFLFMITLFPNLFHYIWTLPLSLIFSRSPPPADSIPIIMSWTQKQITLPQQSRGSYLVTDEVVKALPEIKGYKVGLLNLFVQHTSCALSLNENCMSLTLLSRDPMTLKTIYAKF